ncbi:phage integrase N-terminal SAM-like domain-containing protein [Zoogloea sp.]|uniref:phage integrase N-terminal SAM-like domain-containing protein n=1 Tax=Zoogloea sp. TaxID=49181 RepID=UPI00258EAC46|nr:phage integrase N-terminal SAM-like domain-containing protein [Zoogloea sp.]MDD2669746.1 phage integrase N-terminal SAM-like domain-containing protein [Zoogloea sp.]
MMSSTLLVALPSSPRLLDLVRERIRVKHYSLRTEQAYVGWIKRYIFFHDKRHPRDMGKVEVEAFLDALAVERKVSAATQTQALSASLFLYREMLGIELPWLDDLVRAKKPRRLPSILNRGVGAALAVCVTPPAAWILSPVRRSDCTAPDSHISPADSQFTRGDS